MALIGDSLASSSISADPRSAEAAAKNEEDLNKFLNLLVTQLKYQDPLDPMDASEFTSQLVQFAGVEQQIYANSNLEKLLALEETNQISSLIGLIGKTVEVEGRKLPLLNSKGTLSYTMPAGANKATITITSIASLTVYTGDADTSTGKHIFNWDGRNTGGQIQSDGAYNILVSGTDFQGNLLEIEHSVSGRVTGVSIEDGELSLSMGEAITYGQNKVLSVKETVPP